MTSVSIITGFLGSGKTRFINQIIKNNTDKTLAIIENEVGELSIDHQLLLSAEAGIFQLQNGCICCSLQGDLLQTLEKITQVTQHIDHLIIETTGIAEPDAIAAAFLSDMEIQSQYKLDAVICLVDALHFQGLLLEREEIRRQIAFADVLLLSKTEGLSPAELEVLLGELARLNPLAELEVLAQAQRDWLNLQAYRGDKVKLQTKKACCLGQGHHGHHHQHEHQPQLKHEGIVSHSFEFDRPFDFLKLRHWLQVLLLIQGGGIYRIKGLLRCAGMEETLVLQSVQRLHHWQRLDSDLGAVSQLVFIGKDLRRDILEKNLKNCLA